MEWNFVRERESNEMNNVVKGTKLHSEEGKQVSSAYVRRHEKQILCHC